MFLPFSFICYFYTHSPTTISQHSLISQTLSASSHSHLLQNTSESVHLLMIFFPIVFVIFLLEPIDTILLYNKQPAHEQLL